MPPTQRPVSARTRGVVASAVPALVLALAGCGTDAVPVDRPPLAPDDERACSELVESLPDTLAGLERREVEPASAPAAAYGDPALTVVCGGPMPPGFDEFAECQEVGGVGWYIPPDQVTDPTREPFTDATLGSVHVDPVVAVTVPAEYRPEGLAAAQSELAPYVLEHLTRTDRCV